MYACERAQTPLITHLALCVCVCVSSLTSFSCVSELPGCLLLIPPYGSVFNLWRVELYSGVRWGSGVDEGRE